MGEQHILHELKVATGEHEEWADLGPSLDDPAVSIHLAVMLEPFLSYILNGQKTIESRFAKKAIAPYNKVGVGDLVLLKAGPVVGSFRVTTTKCVVLSDGELDELRRQHAEAICATDDEFWDARADKRYVTLLGIGEVQPLPPVSVPKRDLRGWVIVRAADRDLAGALTLW